MARIGLLILAAALVAWAPTCPAQVMIGNGGRAICFDLLQSHHSANMGKVDHVVPPARQDLVQGKIVC